MRVWVWTVFVHHVCVLHYVCLCVRAYHMCGDVLPSAGRGQRTSLDSL